MRRRLSIFVVALVVALAGLAAGDLIDDRVSARQGAAPAAANATDAGQFSCNASDMRLRACFTFDGDTRDRSSYGNHANAANISYVAGKGGQAVRLGPNSRILLAQHPSLDIAAMTVKMWIRPASFPTKGGLGRVGDAEEGRMGVFDGEATYRMYVMADGIIRCSITGRPEAYSKGSVPLGEWTRVACTFDGAVMRLHFNGGPVAEVKQAGTIAKFIAGLAIGSDYPSGDNFLGEIDQFEIWSAAVAP